MPRLSKSGLVESREGAPERTSGNAQMRRRVLPLVQQPGVCVISQLLDEAEAGFRGHRPAELSSFFQVHETVAEVFSEAPPRNW